MLKKITFFFSLLFISTTIFSQKEANFWYFGANSGFDFNGETPVGITGSLNTDEGCSSISDRNGNLLFYTDGITVWNKLHLAMPNGTGLLGLGTSTQSALILRQPGSDHIYYIFTADGTSSALNHHLENGYRYSIVDMNLDGGSGDVTSIKNILLYAPSTEKLAAVKQADGVSIWLMTHEWNSSKFRAYSLTCNGLDTVAVISDVGDRHEVLLLGAPSYSEAIGQMKFSPDGKRLSVVILGKLRAQLFDFNAATGVLSNPINILAYWVDGFIQPDGAVFDFEYIYGTEFSPDGHLLYLTKIEAGNLFQYDLSSGTSAGISSSGINFEMGPWCTPFLGGGWSCPGATGALQLGPDQKIYMTDKPNLGLSTIANPDVIGTGCNYVKSPVLINPSTNGLPGFMASYFDPEPIKITEQKCLKIKVQTHYNNAASYLWSFNDPNSEDDFSTDPTPEYLYTDTGKYMITLVLTSVSGCSDTIEKNIVINECIPVDQDTSLHFPNVFSPNGDGTNDVFIIKGLDRYPNNEVIIYDRWGNKVFHKQGCTELTSFSGNECKDGVYYYIVSTSPDAPRYSGYLSIVR